MLTENKFVEMIRLQATETFFATEVVSVARQAINDYKKGSSYAKAYNFDEESHRVYDNKHTSHRSRGCGCIWCVSRYELTQARMAVARYKKLYTEFNMGLGDRLVAQHRNYLSNGGTSPIDVYYINELSKLEQIIKGASVRHKAAKEAINEILQQY